MRLLVLPALLVLKSAGPGLCILTAPGVTAPSGHLAGEPLLSLMTGLSLPPGPHHVGDSCWLNLGFGGCVVSRVLSALCSFQEPDLGDSWLSTWLPCSTHLRPREQKVQGGCVSCTPLCAHCYARSPSPAPTAGPQGPGTRQTHRGRAPTCRPAGSQSVWILFPLTPRPPAWVSSGTQPPVPSREVPAAPSCHHHRAACRGDCSF